MVLVEVCARQLIVGARYFKLRNGTAESMAGLGIGGSSGDLGLE